jgi:hypothetical protein
MSYYEPDLAGKFILLKGIHFWNPNFASEMGVIVTALGSDATTRPCTTETPALALRIGSDKSPLTNDALLLVNSAKSGNMSADAIIGALDVALGTAYHPVNVDVPYASANASPAIVGTIVTVTTGNWAGAPTSYTYQWKRDGVTNIGTTNSTTAPYTLISGDIGGHAITCVVTATNATGSKAAPPSNPILT